MNPVGMLSRISTRERTMLLALVMVGVLLWFSSLLRSRDEASRRLRDAQRELGQQAVWLRDADRFERELTGMLSLLEVDSTLDASALVTLVDGLARDGGLKQELGTPVTAEGEVFLQHTLRVNVKNAALADLIAFERGLRAQYPYAAVEDLSISANKADPRLLNARLTITSYQIRDASAVSDAPSEGGEQ